MPQKKLFAALLVAASALLMLGMSNENQIPYPSNYDTKSAGASSYNGLTGQCAEIALFSAARFL